MKIFKLFFFLFFVPFWMMAENTSSPLLKDNESLFKGWMEDIAIAQKLSLESKRPLLIAFLGPNWCSWSDKLEREVLAKPSFLESLQPEVIFLKVDIPEDFTHTFFIGNSLQQEYNIQQCPTLLLIQPSGQEIARLEHMPFEGKPLAEAIKHLLGDFTHLLQLREEKQLKCLHLDELKSLYHTAIQLTDRTFKEQLLKEGLKTDRGPYFLLQQYKNMRESPYFKKGMLNRVRNKILARDPENKQGSRLKLALIDFTALAETKEYKNTASVIAPLTQYLKKFGKVDKENAWKLEMRISQYLFSHDQVKDALHHAKISLVLAPDAEKKEINQAIDYLQNHLL